MTQHWNLHRLQTTRSEFQLAFRESTSR